MSSMHDRRPWLIAFVIVYLPLFLNGFFDLSFIQLKNKPYLLLLDMTYFVIVPMAALLGLQYKGKVDAYKTLAGEFAEFEFRQVLWGIFFGWLFFRVTTLLESRVPDLSSWIPYWQAKQTHGGTGTGSVVLVLYGAITAAVVEEMAFKPVLRRALSKVRGKAYYVGTAAALFAAMHFEQGLFGLAVAAGYGLMSAAYYAEGGRMTTLITMHFISNFLFFLSKT